VPLLGHRRG
jgi:hypothetical protein